MAGYSGVYGDVGLFADHNVENHIVGVLHSDGAYLSEIHNGLLDILLDDAVVL